MIKFPNVNLVKPVLCKNANKKDHCEEKCPWSHENIFICRYDGNCRFGDSCNFRHTKKVIQQEFTKPQRKCWFGSRCGNHEELHRNNFFHDISSTIKNKCYYGIMCDNDEEEHREMLTHDDPPIFVKKECKNGSNCNTWEKDPFSCPFWHGITIQERFKKEDYSDDIDKDYYLKLLKLHADFVCPNIQICEFEGCPYTH